MLERRARADYTRVAEEFVDVRRSNRLVLLVGAVVALALPAISSAQVTPFDFAVVDGFEFAPVDGTPHTFDLRSIIRLRSGGTFNPAQADTTLTISQGTKTLFSLFIPAGSSGWRVEPERIRFDGVVSSVDLSIDFRLRDQTFGQLEPGTEIAFDTEGDASVPVALQCDGGVAQTTVGLQLVAGDETAGAVANVAAEC
jgi:hypothetical protein